MSDATEADDKKLAAIDEEISAIKAILAALAPLKPEARSNVIDYVFRHLGITALALSSNPIVPPAGPLPVPPATPPPHAGAQIDLRTLTEQKKPKSDNQMVAILAYYLANHAPTDQRRDYIIPDDIKRYFPLADFELPTGSHNATLVNAKNAGYLDALGSGQYRLNPVGHNLVTHKLPRGEGSTSTRGARKKAVKKKRPGRDRASGARLAGSLYRLHPICRARQS